MNDALQVLKWLAEGQVYRVCSKVPFLSYERKAYGTKKILDTSCGTQLLLQGVESDRPFLAGRFGTSECNALVRYLLNEKFKINSYGYHLDEMVNNAGFFPPDAKMLNQYCELVKCLYNEIDLLCIMNCVAEGYVVEKYASKAALTRLPVVDPLRTCWTSCLEGKRVLVIHPMADTIQKQYTEKRPFIFPNDNILPQFELQTVKAVQTVARTPDDRFNTWFDALDYMTEQALKRDFDIALIGCGAYGLPLGCQLKKHGKKAVHMGGCLQLLFGIRGERWDNRPEYQSFITDAWVRPSKSERPQGFSNVEGGCYW